MINNNYLSKLKVIVENVIQSDKKISSIINHMELYKADLYASLPYWTIKFNNIEIEQCQSLTNLKVDFNIIVTTKVNNSDLCFFCMEQIPIKLEETTAIIMNNYNLAKIKHHETEISNSKSNLIAQLSLTALITKQNYDK